MLIRTPYQQTTIAVFAGYFGVATGESFIIDTDHWRHTFLLMGLMWGLIAASPACSAGGRGARSLRHRACPGHSLSPSS